MNQKDFCLKPEVHYVEMQKGKKKTSFYYWPHSDYETLKL